VHTINARDGRDIANKIETQLLVERRVDDVVRTDDEQGVAVRWCADDRLGTDIATCPRPVLNDEGL
jgi:hypothetical protein